MAKIDVIEFFINSMDEESLKELILMHFKLEEPSLEEVKEFTSSENWEDCIKSNTKSKSEEIIEFYKKISDF